MFHSITFVHPDVWTLFIEKYPNAKELDKLTDMELQETINPLTDEPYTENEIVDIRKVAKGVCNTWDDWALLSPTVPYVTAPNPKTQYTDIPGSDGSIDLSTVLTGDIAFSDRSGAWTFIEVNDIQVNIIDDTTPIRPWVDLHSDVCNWLSGTEKYAILDDDPGFYYHGRFTVGTSLSSDYPGVVINFQVEPYKKELCTSNENWLWDPFSFVNGIIREPTEYQYEFKFTSSSESFELMIPARRQKTVLRVTTRNNLPSSSNIKIKVDRVDATGSAIETAVLTPHGDRVRYYAITLPEGENVLKFYIDTDFSSLPSSSYFRLWVYYIGGSL